MTRNEILSRFPNASEDFIKKNLSNQHPRTPAELEPNISLPPLEKTEVQEAASKPILVRVTSRRKRLIDEDNLCEKYHVDLLRYSGIIQDDCPSKTKIEVAQIKCKKGEGEEILIEVFE